MLLTREKKIVALLMKNEENKLTTTQIATSLKVSSRTIKTDIKKINEEIENHSCRINSQQGVGLWIEYDSSDGKKYLTDLIQEDEGSYLSPGVRKYHLAVELLLQDEYISMESLALKYFISKATVLNDLSELDDFWNQFKLSFVKKVKYGVKVEGTEIQKRSALIEAVKQAGGKREVTIPRIQQHFENVNLDHIRAIVNRMERRFQFVLTDPSVEELIIALAVMLERLSNGKRMDHSSSVLRRNSRRMNFVLSFLKEQLTEEMELYIPDEEDGYLRICLNGLRFHVPMEGETDLDSKKDRDPELFSSVVEFLKECDEKFYLNIEDDEELIGNLIDHLECMLLRMHSNLYTYNPILESIKNELLYEYEIASYFMSLFATQYEFEPTEDEIGFVTFHIGASVERMKQRKNQMYTATIVCMTGFGTSQFLKLKLTSYLQNVDVKEVISAKRLSELKPENQDFIITTVPIELENIPVIQVSPVLNDSDIKKIQNFLLKNKEKEPEEKRNYDYLRKFLHSEITILDCDLKSKEEVIHLLGLRMISEGYADEGFIDSVFERENLSETALGNLIAIPHAFEGHILKQGIGLLTLKKPISWGDEKVQIVFLLSLGAPSKEYIKGIFGDVLELTKDKKAIETMIKAKKYTNIFK